MERLSNGLKVEIQNRRDAEVLFSSVQSYFTPKWPQDPQAVIIDVGANVDMFALECLRRTNGQARLVCCEPAPPNFELLTRNIAANFPHSAAVLKSAALSSQAGTARFLYRPVAPYSSSLSGQELPSNVDPAVELIYTDDYWKTIYGKMTSRILKWFPRWLTRRLLSRVLRRMKHDTVAYDCTLMTLSALIDEFQLPRVDVLKIDVEGAEWEVLQGLEDRHWPLVGQVLVEVHNLNGRLRQTEELLRRHGFHEIQIDQELILRGTEIYNVSAFRAN